MQISIHSLGFRLFACRKIGFTSTDHQVFCIFKGFSACVKSMFYKLNEKCRRCTCHSWFLRNFYASHRLCCVLCFCAASDPAYVLINTNVTERLSFVLSTDHSELHAPLPTQVPCGLCRPAQGQREVRRGELQNLCFWGNPLHGRHSLPEPSGECSFTKPARSACVGSLQPHHERFFPPHWRRMWLVALLTTRFTWSATFAANPYKNERLPWFAAGLTGCALRA